MVSFAAMKDCWPREELDAATLDGLIVLGRAVRRGRTACGVSQRQLARLAGVHPSTISRLESGKLRGMYLKTLARIIAALNGYFVLHGYERPRRRLADGNHAVSAPWWER
jgi:transcriptional regulator with XRE-family HTH domain